MQQGMEILFEVEEKWPSGFEGAASAGRRGSWAVPGVLGRTATS